MNEINLTQQFILKNSITVVFNATKNQLEDLNAETDNKHFTKTINGQPGLNSPDRTHYPRSYSADGPGGNYSGL